MASGLSMPVGFKNTTDGNVDAAINAIKAAQVPHTFLGIDQEGRTSIVSTAGNPHGHVILRGGDKPNYDRESVAQATARLSKAALSPRLMIDCSHGNSRKDHRNQPAVAAEVAAQVASGSRSVCGVMLESHLFEGNLNSTLSPVLAKAEVPEGMRLTATIHRSGNMVIPALNTRSVFTR